MSYRKLNPIEYSDHTTWLNLGYWKENCIDFDEANLNLAKTIGLMVKDCQTIIDVGCGRGDSLELWNSDEFKFTRILGVNNCRDEYEFASNRFHSLRHISLFYSDALEFVGRDLQLKNFAIVSIDAMYHFRPNRLEFLSVCRESGAKRFAGSDIVLSSRWAREMNKMDFITNYLRKALLSFIGLAAAVPAANLSYGPLELVTSLNSIGWKVVSLEKITRNVFKPFSEFCFRRATKFSWFSKEKWSLLSTGYFMNFIAWTGALDFVLFSLEPINSEQL